VKTAWYATPARAIGKGQAVVIASRVPATASATVTEQERNPHVVAGCYR